MPNVEFNYTGSWERWRVPQGVKWIDLVVTGGGSGPRAAGKVTGRLKVNGGDDLRIFVGRQGHMRSGSDGGTPVGGGGGRGGDATSGELGGNSGGGASWIRKNSTTGRVLVAAGGAGGTSGDGGVGGLGGGRIGAPGSPGDGGSGNTSNATGGTQDQRGRGGTSDLGSAFYGRDGGNGLLARGGRGGGPSLPSVIGGGGGGGGYHPGGGGHAGRRGVAPAGGGAGGSNYTDLLTNVTNEQGGGGTENGRVRITWLNPNDPNNPPAPPEDITINGKPIQDELATKAVGSVTVRGTPNDPDAAQGVRLFIRMSSTKEFAKGSKHRGNYDPQERRDKVIIRGLRQNTLYYLRLHTQDRTGEVSKNYRSTSFWTNRSPLAPTLQTPPENAEVDAIDNVVFTWQVNDDDPNDGQTAFRLRWRVARTPLAPPGPWTRIEQETDQRTWTLSAGTFLGSTVYEWQVKTRDAGSWGEWSNSNSFYVIAPTQPPLLLSPRNDEAMIASEPITFRWQFRSPSDQVAQQRADVRYRVRGTSTWITLTGDGVTPGAQQEWTIPPETLEPGYRYEWSARAYSSVGLASEWTDPESFWAVATPGLAAGVEVVESGTPSEPLGQGHHRAYIYDRGGKVYRGEITGVTKITWHRKRDDISDATVEVEGWDADALRFFRSLRTWQHELVLYRNGVRVWEGPLTLISGTRDKGKFQAHDPMAYVFRRVMRQGYDDTYRVVNGVEYGLTTVVNRAARIALNALAYDDPNLLPYLTTVNFIDDAPNSRRVPDFSRNAWEEIDDLAANAGLDYTVVGRRIIFWDTHQPLGRLPEMGDGDFSDPPVVTEYGMSAANFFAVTTSTGVYGYSSRGLNEDGTPPAAGFIEQVASAYGEAETESGSQTLTRAARNKLEDSLTQQADRNVAGRWPPPLHVRVPDNSTLNPMLDITINQLVPGVWIPLRSEGSFREAVQWQKLDSVTVTEGEGGETIAVVMSPAPNGGQDPDAEAALLED